MGGFAGGDKRLKDSEQRQVVALRATGGEDHLRRAAAEERRDRLAGVVDGGAGMLALLMDGAGVAEVLDPERAHRVEDLGEQRRGGVRVHVDAAHVSSLRGGAACRV